MGLKRHFLEEVAFVSPSGEWAGVKVITGNRDGGWEGRELQAEGSARAKALRREGTLCFQGAKRPL